MKRNLSGKWKSLNRKRKIIYSSIAGCLVVVLITVSVITIFNTSKSAALETVQRENTKAFQQTGAISADGYITYGNLSQTFNIPLSYNGLTTSLEVEEVYGSSGTEVAKGDSLLKVTEESYTASYQLLTEALAGAKESMTTQQLNYSKSKLEADAAFLSDSGLDEAAAAEYNLQLTELAAKVQDASDALTDANNIINSNPNTIASNISQIDTLNTQINDANANLPQATQNQTTAQENYKEALKQYEPILEQLQENLLVQKYLTAYAGENTSEIDNIYQEIKAAISAISSSSSTEQSTDSSGSDSKDSESADAPSGGTAPDSSSGTPPSGGGQGTMQGTSSKTSGSDSLFTAVSMTISYSAGSDISDLSESNDGTEELQVFTETAPIAETELITEPQTESQTESQTEFQTESQAQLNSSAEASALSKMGAPTTPMPETQDNQTKPSGDTESNKDGTSEAETNNNKETDKADNADKTQPSEDETQPAEGETSNKDSLSDITSKLSEEYEKLLVNYKELKSSYTAAAASLESAKKVVTDYNSTISTNEKSITTLEEENTKLNEEYEKAAESTSELQLSYTEALNNQTTQTASLKEEYKSQMSEYDAAQDTYDITIASLDKTLKTYEDTVTEAQENLDSFQSMFASDGTLKALSAGTLSSIGYKAGDTLSSQTPIAVYEDQSICNIVISVSQDDITSVEVGDEAMVSVTDSGRLTGTVSSISQQAESQGISNVTYDVTVSLEESDTELEEGASATVSLNMQNSMPQGNRPQNNTSESSASDEAPPSAEQEKTTGKQEESKS